MPSNYSNKLKKKTKTASPKHWADGIPKALICPSCGHEDSKNSQFRYKADWYRETCPRCRTLYQAKAVGALP